MRFRRKVTLDDTGLLVTVELQRRWRTVAMTTCGPEDDTDQIAEKLRRGYLHEPIKKKD